MMPPELIKLVAKGGALTTVCIVCLWLLYFTTNILTEELQENNDWQEKTYNAMVNIGDELERHNEQMLQMMRRVDLRAEN